MHLAWLLVQLIDDRQHLLDQGVLVALLHGVLAVLGAQDVRYRRLRSAGHLVLGDGAGQLGQTGALVSSRGRSTQQGCGCNRERASCSIAFRPPVGPTPARPGRSAGTIHLPAASRGRSMFSRWHFGIGHALRPVNITLCVIHRVTYVLRFCKLFCRGRCAGKNSELGICGTGIGHQPFSASRCLALCMAR